MNTGAPGQKSKLVESFLLLSLFRLPLRPPFSLARALRQVALPCEAGSAAGLRGQRWPERREAACRPRAPPGTPGQPRTLRRSHQTFPPRHNTRVKPEGNAARPSPHPVRARSCPRLYEGTAGQSRGGSAPLVPIASSCPRGKNALHADLTSDREGRAVPAHTWALRHCPGSVPAASREHPPPLRRAPPSPPETAAGHWGRGLCR